MATQQKNLSDFSETDVPSAAPYHFGIVVAEWNSAITNALYQGAYESDKRYVKYFFHHFFRTYVVKRKSSV